MPQIPVIVFDVRIESDAHTDVEVMRRIFAQSPGIRLRTRSPLTYQSGSYEQTLQQPEVWTGRLERIRTGPVSTVEQRDGFYHFVDRDTTVPTSHATTYFAFVPSGRLLIYRDSAEMPFTRLASYVAAAVQQAAEDGFEARCEIIPRQSLRPFNEWIKLFTTIERVRIKFRHSRSPGNQAIDSILECLNAEVATEVVKAGPKESLNKAALLDQKLPLGQAFDHVEKEQTNGDATIFGHMGEQSVKFSSRFPVDRHMVEVADNASSFRSPLARFAAMLLSIGARNAR